MTLRHLIVLAITTLFTATPAVGADDPYQLNMLWTLAVGGGTPETYPKLEYKPGDDKKEIVLGYIGGELFVPPERSVAEVRVRMKQRVQAGGNTYTWTVGNTYDLTKPAQVKDGNRGSKYTFQKTQVPNFLTAPEGHTWKFQIEVKLKNDKTGITEPNFVDVSSAGQATEPLRN